jgi:tetratricopeptide (TPR) repeat protein
MLTFIDCSSQQKNKKVDIESKFEEGLTFMDNGEYDKAEKIFIELDQLSPELIGIKMNLSVIEQEKGNKQKAIYYLEEALKIAPNHPPVVRLLSELTNEKEYQEKFEELVNKVIELSSEQYYKDFIDNNPVVNLEYAKFDIKMRGEIIHIDKDKNIVYLNGMNKNKESSLICMQGLPLIKKHKEGETVEFIGYSFGIGDDSSEPIIVFKKEI